jgi:hypothetical protein
VAVAFPEHCRKLPSLLPFLSGAGDLGYFSARYKLLNSLKNFLLRAGQVGKFVGAAFAARVQAARSQRRDMVASKGPAHHAGHRGRDRRANDALNFSLGHRMGAGRCHEC